MITVLESVGRVQSKFDDKADGPKSGLVSSDPETAAGKREIPLPDIVVKALRAHKAKQNEDKVFLGLAYQDNDLVSVGPGEHPLSQGLFTQGTKPYWRR